MHASVMAWVRQKVRDHDLASRSVLEVGSLNVNGSVRELFDGDYLGIDQCDGPGVDKVADACSLPKSWANRYEVVVSTEMLEHEARPWLAVSEMARVLKKNGYLLLTCRGYDLRGCFPVHEFPDDCYRFSAGALRILAEDAGLTDIAVEADPGEVGWCVLARKPGGSVRATDA